MRQPLKVRGMGAEALCQDGRAMPLSKLPLESPLRGLTSVPLEP